MKRGSKTRSRRKIQQVSTRTIQQLNADRQVQDERETRNGRSPRRKTNVKDGQAKWKPVNVDRSMLFDDSQDIESRDENELRAAPVQMKNLIKGNTCEKKENAGVEKASNEVGKRQTEENPVLHEREKSQFPKAKKARGEFYDGMFPAEDRSIDNSSGNSQGPIEEITESPGGHIRRGPVAPKDVTTQQSGLSRFAFTSAISKIEASMETKFGSLHAFIDKRFVELDEKISDLRNRVKEGKSVVSVEREENCSGHTAFGNFLSKLKNATMHVEWIFDEPCLSRIVCLAMSVFVFETATERTAETAKLFKEGFHAIMFSLLPGGKSSEWKQGVGMRHSKFRKIIVLNAVFNAQKNRFGKFSEDFSSKDSYDFREKRNESQCSIEYNSIRSSVSAKQSKIPHPSWLKDGYITLEDIETAQHQHENTLSRKKGAKDGSPQGCYRWYQVKDVPTRNDIATYGCFRLFSLVKAFLNMCRRNAKKTLFENLLYFMIPWRTHGVQLDQEKVSLSWAEEGTFIEDISTIPLCKDNSCNTKEADVFNSELYSSFLSRDRSMMLAVRHEVHVSEHNRKGRRTEPLEVKELRRVINLIDVSARFCASFSGCNAKGFDILPFLRGSKFSLRCIVAISYVLRDLTKSFMEVNVMNDGSFIPPSESNWGNIGLDETTLLKKTSKVLLHDLVPGYSERVRIMERRCLNMNPATFLNYNIPVHIPDREGTFRGGSDTELPIPNQNNAQGTRNLEHLGGVYHI